MTLLIPKIDHWCYQQPRQPRMELVIHLPTLFAGRRRERDPIVGYSNPWADPNSKSWIDEQTMKFKPNMTRTEAKVKLAIMSSSQGTWVLQRTATMRKIRSCAAYTNAPRSWSVCKTNLVDGGALRDAIKRRGKKNKTRRKAQIYSYVRVYTRKDLLHCSVLLLGPRQIYHCTLSLLRLFAAQQPLENAMSLPKQLDPRRVIPGR